MTGAPGEVGQGCHAAHGVSCEGEWAFNAKRYEERGQIVGELLDTVSVHGGVGGVAMAAMVVTDDPNAAERRAVSPHCRAGLRSRGATFAAVWRCPGPPTRRAHAVADRP